MCDGKEMATVAQTLLSLASASCRNSASTHISMPTGKRDKAKIAAAPIPPAPPHLGGNKLFRFSCIVEMSMMEDV